MSGVLLLGMLAGCGEAGDGGGVHQHENAATVTKARSSAVSGGVQYDIYRSDPVDANDASPVQKNTAAQAAASARRADGD